MAPCHGAHGSPRRHHHTWIRLPWLQAGTQRATAVQLLHPRTAPLLRWTASTMRIPHLPLNCSQSTQCPLSRTCLCIAKAPQKYSCFRTALPFHCTATISTRNRRFSIIPSRSLHFFAPQHETASCPYPLWRCGSGSPARSSLPCPRAAGPAGSCCCCCCCQRLRFPPPPASASGTAPGRQPY